MILRTSGKVFRPSFPTIIKGTLTGVRISAVDAGAFLDNCADVLPYVDGKSIIRLKDADGKSNVAILGALGTVETYTANSIANNADFSSDEPPGNAYTRQTGWTVSGGVGVAATAGNLYIQQALSVVASSGQLVKTSFGLTHTSGAFSFEGNGGTILFTSRTSSATFTEYKTMSDAITSAGITTRGGLGGAGTIDDLYWVQILTPSALGCTLLNAIGGAQSFISKDAAFTYNADSYTYEIFTTLRIANPRSIMGVNTFRN